MPTNPDPTPPQTLAALCPPGGLMGNLSRLCELINELQCVLSDIQEVLCCPPCDDQEPSDDAP